MFQVVTTLVMDVTAMVMVTVTTTATTTTTTITDEETAMGMGETTVLTSMTVIPLKIWSQLGNNFILLSFDISLFFFRVYAKVVTENEKSAELLLEAKSEIKSLKRRIDKRLVSFRYS